MVNLEQMLNAIENKNNLPEQQILYSEKKHNIYLYLLDEIKIIYSLLSHQIREKITFSELAVIIIALLYKNKKKLFKKISYLTLLQVPITFNKLQIHLCLLFGVSINNDKKASLQAIILNFDNDRQYVISNSIVFMRRNIKQNNYSCYLKYSNLKRNKLKNKGSIICVMEEGSVLNNSYNFIIHSLFKDPEQPKIIFKKIFHIKKNVDEINDFYNYLILNYQQIYSTRNYYFTKEIVKDFYEYMPLFFKKNVSL